MFTGAAFYISIAEHPARLCLEDVHARAQWKVSYERGRIMQAGLVLIAGLLGLSVAWQTGEWRWGLGAVLVLLNWPYTLLCITPLNHQLTITKPATNRTLHTLLKTWGRLHAVRTAFGFAATLVYLWALD